MLKRNKLFLLIIMILSVFLISGCKNKNTDAYKFKEEYESLNGTTNSSGKEIRTINIIEDNPFIYATAEEIVEKINSKETFIVYFGFASCPWCRSVLETLISASSSAGIKKIYYVDVSEIRDTYEIKDGTLVRINDGTKGYNELLTLLGSKLSDYTLNVDGKTINTGEKRIYAPNVVGIIKGEVNELTTGISPLQTDAYMELTDEMINDTKESFKKVLVRVFTALNSCDEAC